MTHHSNYPSGASMDRSAPFNQSDAGTSMCYECNEPTWMTCEAFCQQPCCPAHSKKIATDRVCLSCLEAIRKEAK